MAFDVSNERYQLVSQMTGLILTLIQVVYPTQEHRVRFWEYHLWTREALIQPFWPQSRWVHATTALLVHQRYLDLSHWNPPRWCLVRAHETIRLEVSLCTCSMHFVHISRYR